MRGIHRSPVNSPHKGQWRGALMFSLICVWINGWVNNREAGDLRRYRAHYDVTVMNLFVVTPKSTKMPVMNYPYIYRTVCMKDLLCRLISMTSKNVFAIYLYLEYLWTYIRVLSFNLLLHLRFIYIYIWSIGIMLTVVWCFYELFIDSIKWIGSMIYRYRGEPGCPRMCIVIYWKWIVNLSSLDSKSISPWVRVFLGEMRAYTKCLI